MRWRLVATPPADGAANMALDEALMRRAARTGDWVLRVYGWCAPTLSLGRNQRAAGRYDLERAAAAGVAFVRRPTGGRGLLHDAEVTYSVTAPCGAAGSLGASYARINGILVEAIRSLGVDATVAAPVDGGRARRPDETPCFDHPAPGEIVAGGRKLAGSAQWRDGGALLQHGSILLDGTQALAAGLLREPTPPPPPAATLRALLGCLPSHDTVAAALFAAVRATEDADARPLAPEPEVEADRQVFLARYRDPAWTWRR